MGQQKIFNKPLNCYGPDTRVAYVRWVPSSDATQTLTDAMGVSSVTRSAAGVTTVNFSASCKAIVPLFAGPVDNSTSAPGFLRVTATDASAGTASLLHTAGATGNVSATTVLTDISTASSAFVAAPVAGTITSIRTVLGGAIATADAAISTEINGVAVTNGTLTVENASSAAGDRDSATPTAANTVAVGDALEVITDGASTNTVPLYVTFVITPTTGSDTSDELCAAFLLRMVD